MKHYPPTSQNVGSPFSFSYDQVLERKAKRREVLEAVAQRRAENYKLWHRKIRLRANGELDKLA
jgi:hypothetical protein